ncbi:MAG TPA: asparaginase [Sulfurivirga caldicuralii]|nr:asparaginase [Sulfurivirga caldicuralii]
MIHLLITGGTLDKDYDPIGGELTFPGSCVPGMLEQARCTVALESTVLMQKDSLEMDDADRAQILQACQHSPHQHIVITHGTDTLVKTGRVLAEARLDKVIVLTGAMRPHRLGRSDALFNLGAAMMAVQLAAKGVWVAMNGQLLPVAQTQKNRRLGRFERVSS